MNIYSKSAPVSRRLVRIYGIERAEKLIEIFHQVIQSNLEDQISGFAFLPVLVTEGDGLFENELLENELFESELKPNVKRQVALFEQRPAEGKKSFCGERWAVLNLTNREVTVHPVQESNQEAYYFLNNVRSHLPNPSSKRYDTFVRKFRAVLLFNEDKVAAVVMRAVSMYDRNLRLTNHNWAVTVITSFRECDNCSCFGHAMIGWEGLRDGELYSEYAHIVPIKKTTTALVKFKQEYELERETVIINGPAWRRPRPLVERMIKVIDDYEQNKIKLDFSMSRGVIRDAVIFGFKLFFSPIGGMLIHSDPTVEKAINCTGWVIEDILPECGIEVNFPLERVPDSRLIHGSDTKKIVLTPGSLMDRLNNNRATVRFFNPDEE